MACVDRIARLQQEVACLARWFLQSFSGLQCHTLWPGAKFLFSIHLDFALVSNLILGWTLQAFADIVARYFDGERTPFLDCENLPAISTGGFSRLFVHSNGVGILLVFIVHWVWCRCKLQL